MMSSGLLLFVICSSSGSRSFLDSRPGSIGVPLVSTQQTASSGVAGAAVSSQGSASSPPQNEEGRFVFKKKVEEVVLVRRDKPA
jgi:hypothetical protein